jgi:hypothetical protein
MRKLDFSVEMYFECGGKKFFVTDSLSFNRYREMQKLMIEFGYSATFKDIFDNLKLSIDAFNKHKYDEMVIIVHNVLNGITKIETKDDPAIRLCALFINEEGEDATTYSEGQMKSKIDCWTKELDIAPFFYLAASLVAHWMPAYELTIQNGLKPETIEGASENVKKE